MSKLKLYYIINRVTKKEDFTGTYDGCLEYYQQQDKSYKRLHKIIDEKEYNKIIKKNKYYET